MWRWRANNTGGEGGRVHFVNWPREAGSVRSYARILLIRSLVWQSNPTHTHESSSSREGVGGTHVISLGYDSVTHKQQVRWGG